MVDAILHTRYRTLQAALTLIALVAIGGAVAMLQLPTTRMLELALFSGAALVCVALIPFAHRAARRRDRDSLERTALVGLIIGSALILQRTASTVYGTLFDDPGVDLFRVHYACMLLLYLVALAVMRARLALRYCWGMWALTVALALPGLWLTTGFDTSRPGLVAVLVWLLVANPMFLLVLRALPQYEERIEQDSADLAEMRGRTELMDKLAESERRFNLVVEGLEVGVWDRWVGPPQRRWWSPRFFELLGYAPTELEPTEDNLRALLHPDDRERVWQLGTQQLQKGDLMDLDFRFNTKHRGYRWFNSRAHAERDANGKLVRLAGSLTDIHDRRVAEEALHAAQSELTRLAYRDTLTDLYNRRYFDEHFQREWERARRSRQPLALLLLDLDHFKAYNDRYGHAAGDSCLVEFSLLMARCATRPADIVARLGGEEFGLVLPETSAVRGAKVAQRLQLLLQQNAIPHEGSPLKVLTFSAGVAAIETPDGPGPAELFEQADRALYEIKRRGRDGVLRYDELPAGAAYVSKAL
ncbi:MAG: diguanylate cyclase domain-containing protein [Gammaproteobacteria bacterium]